MSDSESVLVYQEVSADTYLVSVDVKDVVIEHLPAILRALKGNMRLVTMIADRHPTSIYERRSLEDTTAHIRKVLAENLTGVRLDLDPEAARDLAAEIALAAAEPETCENWTGCGNYRDLPQSRLCGMCRGGRDV